MEAETFPCARNVPASVVFPWAVDISNSASRSSSPRPARLFLLPPWPVPQCGLPLESLRSKGRLGCLACAAAFKPELERYMRSRSRRPYGQAKAKAKARVSLPGASCVPASSHAEALKAALEAEDYEAAAVIRDGRGTAAPAGPPSVLPGFPLCGRSDRQAPARATAEPTAMLSSRRDLRLQRELCRTRRGAASLRLARGEGFPGRGGASASFRLDLPGCRYRSARDGCDSRGRSPSALRCPGLRIPRSRSRSAKPVLVLLGEGDSLSIRRPLRGP